MAVGGATGQNMLKNFATSKMQKKDEVKMKAEDDMDVDSEVEDIDVVIKQTAEKYQKVIEKDIKRREKMNEPGSPDLGSSSTFG